MGSRGIKDPAARGVLCSEVGLKEERERERRGTRSGEQLANFLLPSLQLMQ